MVSSAPRAGGSSWLLAPSVFLGGGAVMVLELLGPHVMSRAVEPDSHAWPSLIAVTMVSLALGSWLGGRWSDRAPRADHFFALLALTSLLTLVLLPALAFLDGRVRATDPLAGALCFSAPMTLLGMLTPFAVRLAARELGSVGQTAGRLFAISTAGSLAGTLLAGFVFVPPWPARGVIGGVAAALLVPALLHRATRSTARKPADEAPRRAPAMP